MTSSLAPWFRASLGSCTVAVLLSLAQVSAPRAVAQPTLRPRVVLISLDGFRADYLDRPGAVHLRALASRGVRAERLVPSFPSKTFPNHYTLVTGLYPEHHGITANVMQDSLLGRFATGNDPSGRDARWWLGEPIWVTAERQQMHTAVLFWPGNEAAIGGVRPHWWQRYDGAVTHAQRVQQVLSWLSMPDESAPRFLAVYFSEVDSKGHDFGPRAPQTDSAIARVDSAVGAIAHGITALNFDDRVNLIVVSDHGMTEIARDRLIALDELVSPDSLTVVDMEPVSAIVPKPGAEDYVLRALRGAHPHLAVWRKRDVPARFHFNSGTRIAPIVALADEGWTVVASRNATTMVPGQVKGAHGYDNQLPSMGALFVAAGPAFKRGLRVAPFENVHVYPLLAHVLGLTPAHTDGSLTAVRAILR
jgi:predicted AlkP superfamily pyrophosphatase or phosphodiesterase